jgi:hypothetical protein
MFRRHFVDYDYDYDYGLLTSKYLSDGQEMFLRNAPKYGPAAKR